MRTLHSVRSLVVPESEGRVVLFFGMRCEPLSVVWHGLPKL